MPLDHLRQPVIAYDRHVAHNADVRIAHCVLRLDLSARQFEIEVMEFQPMDQMPDSLRFRPDLTELFYRIDRTALKDIEP